MCNERRSFSCCHFICLQLNSQIFAMNKFAVCCVVQILFTP
jgi:hypothetical protein